MSSKIIQQIVLAPIKEIFEATYFDPFQHPPLEPPDNLEWSTLSQAQGFEQIFIDYKEDQTYHKWPDPNESPNG